ncbi:MAG TPA: SGNH/GDSL hydrolase family protein [Chitinophagaceae bacterium]|nr:SGNH/GDSL hydrolase family protein [Chitinophagaceae bacterium]HUM64349.1 SGNH/GDSL hydrolase family protein [Chitinophagaceae bacterium]
MVTRYLFLFIFSGFQYLCMAQNTTTKKNVKFYGKEYFLIEGTAIPESEKDSPYDRLPASYKEKVRQPVWDLSKCAAGITARFKSNSTSLQLKWEVLNNFSMNHMPATGIRGVDLYCRVGDTWQYVNTAKPGKKQSEARLVSNMTTEMREYKLFLPLYDGIVSIEIGVDENSVIERSSPSRDKPIVFYGTSITQGGCASRPGMVHTSIISRKLNQECINLGFSGNGRMEKPIAELMADTDAAIYVVDCVPNMTQEHLKTNMLPLVEIIRAKRKSTPIVFVEGTIMEKSFLDDSLRKELNYKNAVLRQQFQQLVERGYVNIYYIESKGALGDDHEATVDGVHFTDLGFLRFADFLIARFRSFKLVK